jgi:hypothetical protein
LQEPWVESVMGILRYLSEEMLNYRAPVEMWNQ